MDTFIRLNKRGDFYFSLKNPEVNNNLEIKRYAYTVVDNLKISLGNALIYTKQIEDLIIKKRISISDICDLLNLIDGKLERINSLSKLSLAIKNLEGMECNKSFISTIIFTNLNKYKIDKDILLVYKFVYENVNASHSYIIKAFFDNLDIFLDLKNLNHLEYKNMLVDIMPFNPLDYLYYLKDEGLYSSYFIKAFNIFNEAYFLLDLIALDLKKNNGVIVPNIELQYYIEYYINRMDINKLDIILNRIGVLNKRAPKRLLVIVIDSLIKDSRVKDKLSLDFFFILLERLDYDDYIHYFKKLYLGYKSNLVIDKLNEREDKNKDYYIKINELLAKDIDSNELLDLKETRRLYKNKNISVELLKSYYQSFYLDKRKNDNGVFVDKLINYLNLNGSLDLGIWAYDYFFKELKTSYKDVAIGIRRVNDFIFKYYEEIYNNVRLYIDKLDEINNKLNSENISCNPYYGLLKIGEGLKNGSQTLKKSILRNLADFNVLANYDKEYLSSFINYYLDSLLDEYYNELIPSYDNYTFLSFFKSILDPLKEVETFSEGIINYFKIDNYNQGKLFYLILASANLNINKYKRITLSILDKINKKNLKKYFNDYLNYLNSNNSINIEYKAKARTFILEYSDNRFNLIAKLILKLKNK